MSTQKHSAKFWAYLSIPLIVLIAYGLLAVGLARKSSYQNTIPRDGPPIYELQGELGETSQAFCGKGEAIMRGECRGVGKVDSMPAHVEGRLGWQCFSSKQARACVRCFGPRKRGINEAVEKAVVASALWRKEVAPSEALTWDWYEIRNRIDGCLDEIDDSE